jgi:hypothetical protein
VIVLTVKVSRGFEPFSPIEIESADTSQPSNEEICMGKSHFLPINPARGSIVPLHLCTNRGGFCTNRAILEISQREFTFLPVNLNSGGGGGGG